MIQVADYTNVRIVGNTFTASDGQPGYFENTVWVPCITLQAVATASIADNTCNNAYDVWDSTNWQFRTADYANSDIRACGNTYGLTMLGLPVLGEAITTLAPGSDAPCVPTG
jgi:hypothetical protein